MNLWPTIIAVWVSVLKLCARNCILKTGRHTPSTRRIAQWRVVVVLAWLCALLHPPLALALPEFHLLVTNVSKIISVGTPGPVESTAGPNDPWAVIASGDGDASLPSVLCLAREYGAGRIVAFGHDGLMFTDAFDDAVFLRNVALWLNQSHLKRIGFSAGHGEFVRSNNATAFHAAVASAGFTSVSLGAPITAERLTNVDLLILGNAWVNFTTNEISVIESFVANGGGLLLIGLGWSWPLYNPASTLNEFPMNLVGETFAVRWRGEVISDPTDNLNGVAIFQVFYPRGRAPSPILRRTDDFGQLTSADTYYAEAKIEVTAPGTDYGLIQGDGFSLNFRHETNNTRRVTFTVNSPVDALIYLASNTVSELLPGGAGLRLQWDYPWQTNVNYRVCTRRLLVNATYTLYGAFLFRPESNGWFHLGTIRRPADIPGFNYWTTYLSDVALEAATRRAFVTGNEWARLNNGQWIEMTRSLFDHDPGNLNTNAFDAEIDAAAFRLETGGATVRDNLPETFLERLPGVFPPDLLTYAGFSDLDHDDLPEEWELHYFGNLNQTGAGDADGDGLSNRLEYLLGSNPLNPATPPVITAVTRDAAGTVRLTVRGETGLTYRLLTSTDLVTWTNLTSITLPFSPVTITNIAGAGAARKMYRVVLP